MLARFISVCYKLSKTHSNILFFKVISFLPDEKHHTLISYSNLDCIKVHMEGLKVYWHEYLVIKLCCECVIGGADS